MRKKSDKKKLSDSDRKNNKVIKEIIHPNYKLNEQKSINECSSNLDFTSDEFSPDIVQHPKKGSISWECLPFSSKKNKQNTKTSKQKNKKKNDLVQQTAQSNGVNLNSIENVKENYNKSDDFIKKSQRQSKTPEKLTNNTTNNNEIQKQHQPYTTSLVNSGFGFGFDLQGGDIDNQLTFIVNVQTNGDAARKGLQDGDILVSIQGKNVIGIRRIAIERILKQYKVDQEIEIVVCRLKDPTYILNLSNKIHNKNKSNINNLNSENQIASVESVSDNSLVSKYRSINEQIFNELISFQDSFINNTSSNKSNNNSSRSFISNSSFNKKSEMQEAKDLEYCDKPINIELNRNSKSKDKKHITLRSANNLQNRRLNDEHLALSNSAQYSSDSGYIETNRKSFYHSDVSILLYDNIVGSAGNRFSTSTERRCSKNDLVVVSYTQQAQFYHPQIQPMRSGNYQYVTKNMQPLTLNSVKSMSMSVNDFTGSILAADRVNLINKQQQQQHNKQFEASSRRSISNTHDLDNSRTERSYNNQAFIYLQQNTINQAQKNQREQLNQQINKKSMLKTDNTNNSNNINDKNNAYKKKNIPSNKLENQQQQQQQEQLKQKQSYASYRDSFDLNLDEQNFIDSSNYTDQNILRNTYKVSSEFSRTNNQQLDNNSSSFNSKNLSSKINLAERKFNEFNTSDQESLLLGLIPTLKDTTNEATLLSSSSTSSTSSTSSSTSAQTDSKKQQHLYDHYESNLLEIPISIPVFESNTKPSAKQRYKTELTPITSVTSFELTNSASSFEKKNLENIISSGSSSSIYSFKQTCDTTTNYSNLAESEIYNLSPKNQAHQVIMPRASRKKTKPYQVACDDPSVSIKQIDSFDQEDKIIEKVSLALPVDSQNVLSDEDISVHHQTNNLISQKVNSDLSLDKTDGYSDLSIKYIDDNGSAPISPQFKDFSEIDGAQNDIERKNNICLIEINHENKSDQNVQIELNDIEGNLIQEQQQQQQMQQQQQKQQQNQSQTPKMGKKSKKEKRNRHTIPILNTNKADFVNKPKKTQSQDSLANVSSSSSSDEEAVNKKSPSKSNSFNNNQRREHLKKRLTSEKSKSNENLANDEFCANKEKDSSIKKVIDWANQSKSSEEVESKEEIEKPNENIYDEIDEAFKSGGDFSMPDSNDEDSLIKNKSNTNKLSILNEGLSGVSNEETHKILSGSKSDSESVVKNENRSITDKSEIKQVNNKIHDSTDTLDSASSYEIRFERKSSITRQMQKTIKDKLAEKNAEWNISIEESIKPEIELANTQALEDLTSVSYNSSSFSCSTEINANLANQSDENKQNNINNFESSSSEFSPRFAKIQNESLEIDDLENALTSSSLMACSLNDEAELKNEELKTGEVPMVLIEDLGEKIVEKNSNNINCTNRIISSLAPSVVLDDGYGSAVSLKQTTNESCSSIDDSEVSLLSNNSNLDVKKLSQLRKISKENKDLSFVKDLSEIALDELQLKQQKEAANIQDKIELTKEETNLDTTKDVPIQKDNTIIRSKLSKKLDKIEKLDFEIENENLENFESKNEEENSNQEKDFDKQLEQNKNGTNDDEKIRLTYDDLSKNKEEKEGKLIEKSLITDLIDEIQKENQNENENENKNESESEREKNLLDSKQDNEPSSSNESSISQKIINFLDKEEILNNESEIIQNLNDTNIKNKNLNNDTNESFSNELENLESSVVTVIEQSLFNVDTTLDKSLLNDNIQMEQTDDANLINIIKDIQKLNQLEASLNNQSKQANDLEANVSEKLTHIIDELIDEKALDENENKFSNKPMVDENLNTENSFGENQIKLTGNQNVYSEDIQKLINPNTDKISHDSKPNENSLLDVINTSKEIDVNDINFSSNSELTESKLVDSNEILAEKFDHHRENSTINSLIESEKIENIEPSNQQIKDSVTLEENRLFQDETQAITVQKETNESNENKSQIQKEQTIEHTEADTLIESKIETSFTLSSDKDLISDKDETVSLDKQDFEELDTLDELNKDLIEELRAEKNLDSTSQEINAETEFDLTSTTTSILFESNKNELNDSFNENIQAQDKNINEENTEQLSNSNGRETNQHSEDYLEDENDLIPPIYYNKNSSKNTNNVSSFDIRKQIDGNDLIKSSNNFCFTNSILSNLEQSSTQSNSSLSSTYRSYDNNQKIKNKFYNNNVSLGPYRSNISPRNTVISKRSGLQKLEHLLDSNYHYSNKAISIRPINKSIESIDVRNKEKQQLKELNEIFACYVERVKFLEASNKKLQIELEALRNRQGNGTKQIEIMYLIELEEAKNVLNDAENMKNIMESKLSKTDFNLDDLKLKNKQLENSLVEDKSRIKILQEQILSNEAEIGLLRRRLNDLHDEEFRLKQETVRISNEISRVSSEIENEMKQRLLLENDKHILEEEIVFMKEIHEKELLELKQEAMKNTGFDPTQYFKNELTNAIRQIREEFEYLNLEQKSELERWYNNKVIEIKRSYAKPITCIDTFTTDQARKLKTQIQEFRQNIIDIKAKNALLECKIRDVEEEINREQDDNKNLIAEKEIEIKSLNENLTRAKNQYEELINSKSDLEEEIKTYRKLLEGEEESDGLRQLVENIERRHKSMNLSNSKEAHSKLVESKAIYRNKESSLQLTGRSTLL